MSISYGLNLGIMNGAADGDLYGDAMRAFQRACDAFLQPIVKGYLTNTPPASPVDGDMYIIGSAPTGPWASYAGHVAKWSALLAAWEFYLPKNGWQFQSNSAREIYRRTGGAWEIFYQEGTWTPAIAGSTTPGTNTYAVQTGTYRRLARQIFVSCSIFMSSKDAAMAGSVQITGLPFTVDVDSAVSFGACLNFTSANDIVGQASAGTTVIDLFTGNASNFAFMGPANLQAVTAIRASSFYPI